jgi:cytochrome c biogenesis protein CcmG, thiol:disulfide interchange protein DsbE
LNEPETPKDEGQDLVSSVLGDARPAARGPEEGGDGPSDGGGRKTGIIVAVVVVGLVMLLWGVIMAGSERKGLDPEKVEGKPAPDFTLPTLFKGDEVTLSAMQGKPVFLNFWASWCGPCKDEGPVLADAYRRWKGSGIQFLGVDVQDSKKWGQEFETNYGIDYDSAFDETGEQYRNWGLTGFPETFLIDADGNIVAKKIGAFYEPAEIDEYLSLLAPGFTPKRAGEISPIPEPQIPEQPDADIPSPVGSA